MFRRRFGLFKAQQIYAEFNIKLHMQNYATRPTDSNHDRPPRVNALPTQKIKPKVSPDDAQQPLCCVEWHCCDSEASK